MNLHRPSRQTLYNALSILAGNLVYSLTVAAFLMPAGLVTGGATGIALAVNRLTGLSASGVLLAVNLAMLALGWAVMGRGFALHALARSLRSPAALAGGGCGGPARPPAAWTSRGLCCKCCSGCRSPLP